MPGQSCPGWPTIIKIYKTLTGSLRFIKVQFRALANYALPRTTRNHRRLIEGAGVVRLIARHSPPEFCADIGNKVALSSSNSRWRPGPPA